MLSKFSVKKPYTVIVSVVLVIILGFVSFDKMTVDLLPDMNLPYAAVMTPYPGASPEEVETVVTRPVEQAMATISNIKTVNSSSGENVSTVMLQFEQMTNMDSATIEMRETLDQISGFWPEGVGNSIIMKLNPTMMPVMIPAVSVKGKSPSETTRIVENQIIPEIESIEGVASVMSYGNIEQTIHVTLKEDKISSVDEEVQKNLDEKFDEASSALEQAKEKVEQSRAELQAGKDKAADEMSSAQAEIEKNNAELMQGKLEVNEKLSQLEVGYAVLDQTDAQIDASEQSLLDQKTQLDTLLSQKSEIEAEYQKVCEKIEQEGESQELLIAKADLAAKLALIEQYDTSMEAIGQGLAQVETTRQDLSSKRQELDEAKGVLVSMKEQLDAGAITLAQARGELDSAQLTAALQMSEASTQLTVGESELKQKEQEIKDAKQQALAGADIGSMLNMDMIQGVLSAQNFNMPAGYVTEDGIDYLIRVGDKFADIEDIRNLVLVDMEGIDPIYLSDIADVELVDNADDTYAKLNGENAILLQIQKQTGYSTGDVTKRIEKKFDSLKADIDQLEVIPLMNQGIYIDMVIGSVFHNLIFGALLALLILFLFLRDIRPTFVIACSIPISIMTAIVFMYFSGVTMNTISLSGLALGVGMLVDNSIVVIENIYRMRNEEHASAKEAAVKGAQQVAGAILASTLTTVCVFLPIVFTEGIARQLFVDMALTIAYSLLASLIAALSLVPMMSAGMLKRTEQKESKVFVKIQNGYEKVLRKALKHKAAVLSGALVLFLLSGVLAASRGTAFMPTMESTEISLSITKPEGTTLDEMKEVADDFTEKLADIPDIAQIGGTVMSSGMMGGGKTITNQVQYYVLLDEDRTISDHKLQKEIEKLAKEEDVDLSLMMSMMDMGMLGGSGITVQIKGRDLDELQRISAEVSDIVKDVKGTKNVSDGMEKTTQELRVMIDKEKAAAHNLTVAQVYQEISKRLKTPAAATSLDTDLDSVDIIVTESRNENLTRDDIQNLVLEIKKQDGTKESIPLADLASFETGNGLQTINRDALSRYMNVTAEVADSENIGIVSRRVEKALEGYSLPEGYTIKMRGEDETINDTMTELFKMLGLAIVFMYLIMVAQFQSLRSPFIVMFTVPLAFTGGLLGLWISNSPVSVIAMVGFVMLSGIIVNNGIVFIDYTNQLIHKGTEQNEALVEAGRTRLRPIVMTALTTILGLTTMALGFGSGADMVQPMAIVTIGGLIYGTILTLFVVPCIFALFHKKEKARLMEGIEEGE